MKRILITTLLFLMCFSSLFAFTDSFSYLKNNTEYNALVKAIKDNEDEEKVSAALLAFASTNPESVDLARIDYLLVRYYMDNKKTDEANYYLAVGYELCDTIAPGLFHDLAYAELVSGEYYITNKMGTGINSSDLTKALYKSYPDEIAVYIQEANRILYSPHIAGGSPKRALERFETLKDANLDLLTLDRFALYAGLGIASEKRGNKKAAIEYLKEAVSIYKGDEVLWSTLSDLGVSKESL